MIEIQWTNERIVPHFCNLKSGDIFYVEDDRRLVFMKIDEVSNEVVTYNAVDLSDATLTHFYDHEEVTPIKAKLVLS